MITHKVILLLCVLVARGGISPPVPSTNTRSSCEAILITGGKS